MGLSTGELSPESTREWRVRKKATVGNGDYLKLTFITKFHFLIAIALNYCLEEEISLISLIKKFSTRIETL